MVTCDATSFDHDQNRWQDGSLWMDGRLDDGMEGGEKEDKGNPEASTGTWIKGDGVAWRRCGHQSYELFSRHQRTMGWGGFAVPETVEKWGEMLREVGA